MPPESGQVFTSVDEPEWEFITATANPDKVVEIGAVLRAALPQVVLLPRPTDVPEVIEDADTLVGNARLKAVTLMRATGKPAISDDTGLFVDALGGAPGIYAARFAGEDATYADNCAKLLAELERVGATLPPERRATFTTVAFVAWPDGRELWCEGNVVGTITTRTYGSGGFGYDPVFAPIEANGETFAQLGLDVKNDLSHRARAFRALASQLSNRFGETITQAQRETNL
jgi:XTP/dITP diphosphohydrolase